MLEKLFSTSKTIVVVSPTVIETSELQDITDPLVEGQIGRLGLCRQGNNCNDEDCKPN
jgi:hypothetical protein